MHGWEDQHVITPVRTESLLPINSRPFNQQLTTSAERGFLMIAVQAEQATAHVQVDRATHLSRVRAAHETLCAAMREMDQLTRGPLPTKETLARTRLAVSRASLTRRRAWGDIYMDLTPVASPDELRLLNHLRLVDSSLQRASTEHVAAWPIDAALTHWEEYCLASLAIRSKMKAALQVERVTLYPLLSRRA